MKQAQLQGQRKGGRDILGRLQHGSCPAGHARADRTHWQDRHRLAGAALAGAHLPHHVRERLGHDDHDPAAHSHIGRRDEPKQRRTIVDPSLGHGQHPRQRGHPGRHEGRCPTRRTVLPPATKHVVLAAFKSCIQTLAGATLARSVLDGTFEGLAMNKAWWRQSSAEWAARAVTDLSDKNQVWTTGSRGLHAHSDGGFRDAATEAAALYARDDLFAKHIEPAPEDPCGVGHGRSIRR